MRRTLGIIISATGYFVFLYLSLAIPFGVVPGIQHALGHPDSEGVKGVAILVGFAIGVIAAGDGFYRLCRKARDWLESPRITPQ
jgi:hypothetical protein